jgi:hypothetical protein
MVDKGGELTNAARREVIKRTSGAGGFTLRMPGRKPRLLPVLPAAVATIESGSQQALKAGHATAGGTTGDSPCHRCVEEIAAASDAPRQGVEEVNVAIGQIDQITRRNAALGEEAAAAAQSLDEHVTRLDKASSIFSVNNEQHSEEGTGVPVRKGERHLAAGCFQSARPPETATYDRTRCYLAPIPRIGGSSFSSHSDEETAQLSRLRLPPLRCGRGGLREE